MKSQSVQISWGITHAAGDHGLLKENAEAIRKEIRRKTILYHETGDQKKRKKKTTDIPC